jgi:hypothetical protein
MTCLERDTPLSIFQERLKNLFSPEGETNSVIAFILFHRSVVKQLAEVFCPANYLKERCGEHPSEILKNI